MSGYVVGVGVDDPVDDFNGKAKKPMLL